MQVDIQLFNGKTARETKFFRVRFTYGDTMCVPTTGEYSDSHKAVKEIMSDFSMIESIREISKKTYYNQKNS